MTANALLVNLAVKLSKSSRLRLSKLAEVTELTLEETTGALFEMSQLGYKVRFEGMVVVEPPDHEDSDHEDSDHEASDDAHDALAI